MYNPAVAVVLEVEPPAQLLSTPGPYRKADYLALPDEPRCELLAGYLVVTPSPLYRHQHVLLALATRLRAFALATGHDLLIAPMDVTLFDHTVLQPDILLIHRERREIVAGRVEGPPDLVIEVLSPSTGRRDRFVKLALYARAGVAEYWIVDPATQTIDFLFLRDDSYTVMLPAENRYLSQRFSGLMLDLDELWDEIDRAITGRLPG